MCMWGRRAPIVVGGYKDPPPWRAWEIALAVVMALGIGAMVATCW